MGPKRKLIRNFKNTIDLKTVELLVGKGDFSQRPRMYGAAFWSSWSGICERWHMSVSCFVNRCCLKTSIIVYQKRFVVPIWYFKSFSCSRLSLLWSQHSTTVADSRFAREVGLAIKVRISKWLLLPHVREFRNLTCPSLGIGTPEYLYFPVIKKICWWNWCFVLRCCFNDVRVLAPWQFWLIVMFHVDDRLKQVCTEKWSCFFVYLYCMHMVVVISRSLSFFGDAWRKDEALCRFNGHTLGLVVRRWLKIGNFVVF